MKNIAHLKFGLHFFPDVEPEEQAPHDYFKDALDLVQEGEKYGFEYVRIVEHYFNAYGGYSPNPLLFLAAAAQRTRHMRLMTGAVLPVFNHPLKLAGELAMTDAISGGRLDIGVARAFLPHEFDAFSIPMDESKARFKEGLNAILELFQKKQVSLEGQFHQFKNMTSYPPPTQTPHPPIWIAAVTTEESFYEAGKNGYNLMAIPYAAERLKPLLDVYRETFKRYHPEKESKVMIGFHMYCGEDHEKAMAAARPRVDQYIKTMAKAFDSWHVAPDSKDYQGYKKMIEKIQSQNFQDLYDTHAVWVGTPDTIASQARQFYEEVGGFDVATLQVMFGGIPVTEALNSIHLFASEGMARISENKKLAINESV